MWQSLIGALLHVLCLLLLLSSVLTTLFACFDCVFVQQGCLPPTVSVRYEYVGPNSNEYCGKCFETCTLSYLNSSLCLVSTPLSALNPV